MSREQQIAMHASFLNRWFDDAEAHRRAAHYVDSGQAWLRQAPKQLELF